MDPTKMSKSLIRQIVAGFRVAQSTPLLWGLVLAGTVIPTYSGQFVSWVTWPLIIPKIALDFFGPLAVSYVILHKYVGDDVDLSSVWASIKGMWPKMLGLVITILLPSMCFLFLWWEVFTKPYPAPPAIWAIILFKYFFIPWITAASIFAVAGIVMHNLDGFRAFVNSMLIATNNLLPVAILGLAFAALSVLPQMLILSLQEGPPAALKALTSFYAITSGSLSILQFTIWNVLEALAYLPIRVIQAATWMTLYIWATARLGYPWLAPKPAA
jgi:hypothetical protein